MSQETRDAAARFTRPARQIALMLLVLGLTGAGSFVALPRVLPVFQANPYLNGFIVFVFFIGVLACFWQIGQLMVSVHWIGRFANDPSQSSGAPRILAPLASLLRARGARMQLGASGSRSILDSVAARIDEAREITRYIVSLLIFLGLLGTFYGLATTIPAIVDTIRGLAPREGEEGVVVFNRLMSGLESQLGGMGVAFASSLLGLAGSLVVGLLELFAGHGQNRFYRELEEWLSSITRVGFASGDEGGSETGALDHVLQHWGEQMDELNALFARAEDGRVQVDLKLTQLIENLSQMAHQMRADDSTASALERVAHGQERLIAVLESNENSGGNQMMDVESRMRLRSIDVQMLRILEEISAGRQESMAELRADLAAVVKTLSAARGQPRHMRVKNQSILGED